MSFAAVTKKPKDIKGDMNIPILDKRRDALRAEGKEQALSVVIPAIAQTVKEAGTLEKAAMTGNMGNFSPAAAAKAFNGAGSNAMLARMAQNLAGGFGKPDEAIEQAMAEQGLDWSRPFAPGRPLDPFMPGSGGARTFNYPMGANIQIVPRNGRISFKTLQVISETYDVAKICIRHLINDVRSLDYRWEALPKTQEDVSADIALAEQFFASPDKRQPFRAWLAEWLQDILRYDAGCLYVRRCEDGSPFSLEVVDGTTMNVLIDYYGRRPGNEHDNEHPAGLLEGGDVPAYSQIIEGLPWKWFNSDEIIYQPWNPLPNSQYGESPLEAALLPANTDIRWQQMLLEYFTAGTFPAGWLNAPQDMSDPAQLAIFQENFDAIMMGDQSKINQIRWLPHGTTFTPAKPDATKFDPQFPLYLMRRTAAAFGVQPQDLGFTEDVNRSTGEVQENIQNRVGLRPLLSHVEDLLNLFVQEHLKLRCQIRFDDGREVEDRLATAQAEGVYMDHGVISPDEVRGKLGMPVDRTKPFGRYVNNSRVGPIPQVAIESISGKINPETFAPEYLIQTPYAAPAGVIPPQGTPEQLQSAETTAQQSRDLLAETTKGHKTEKAESAVGFTTDLGLEGDGLIMDDDEDEDDDLLKEALTATALKRWRANSRSRLKKGLKPRRFTDPNLPADVHDPIWAQLSKANTRADIDAAFQAPKKKLDRAPFHHDADRILAHYAPLVAKALAETFTPNQIEQAISAAYAADLDNAAKAQAWDKSLSDMTLAELQHTSKSAASEAAELIVRKVLEAAKGRTDAMSAALRDLYGDAFLQGSYDAAHAAGATIASSLAHVSESPPATYWDTWTPGYGGAAAQAADGKMAEALSKLDINIQGMTDTSIERIGNQVAAGLEKGLSIQETAKEVTQVVGDPARAEMIANTEMCRASTTASEQTYEEAGVEQVEWMAEADACPDCEANEDGNPYDLDSAPSPPEHPNCRCALAPIVGNG